VEELVNVLYVNILYVNYNHDHMMRDDFLIFRHFHFQSLLFTLSSEESELTIQPSSSIAVLRFFVTPVDLEFSADSLLDDLSFILLLVFHFVNFINSFNFFWSWAEKSVVKTLSCKGLDNLLVMF